MAGVAAGLAAIWAFLEVAFFFRSNMGLWHAGPDAPWGVFSGLFTTDWSFSLRHCPPLTFLGAMFVAALTTWLGVRAQHALGVRLPMRVAALLGFPLGLGISGLVFEFITMAHALYLPVVWLAWALMLGGCEWLCRRRKTDSVNLFDSFETHRDSPRDQIEDCVFWWTGGVLVTLISVAIFWHALFFPETYWDSLILYLGYGRMTFLEHAFHFKAVGQVGIGLGANYPHLFSTYGAAASTLFAHWSDLHQRLAAPLAGLIATLLVYQIGRLVWRRRAIAMAGALLFRSVPHSIAFSTYASDYAIGILIAAAFIYSAILFVRTRHLGAFAIMTAMPATAMQVNYLMGILWAPWLVAVALALLTGPREERFSVNRRAIAILAVCVAGASAWYVRNWVLTGNPVYSFFPKIFTTSVNINPEVMRSADVEWFRNGDGVGRVAEQLADFRNGRDFRDQNAPGFVREATLRDKLAASWLYWQGYETFRFSGDETVPERGKLKDRFGFLVSLNNPITQGPDGAVPTRFFWDNGDEIRLLHYLHSYKFSPLFLGFALPGVLLFAIALVRAATQPREASDAADFVPREATIAFLLCTVLAFALLAFHYLLADFYLYQIVPILVPLAFLGIGAFALLGRGEWRETNVDGYSLVLFVSGGRYAGSLRRVLLYLLLLVVGLVPGLAMSLMNFKIPGGGVVDGQQFSAARLDIFRHPGLDEGIYYRLCYGSDVDMWDYVNEHCKDTKILTHENRHLMFDPSIEFIHLDDWDVQGIYGKPADERLRFFRQRGLSYYLRVPNERKHEVNNRAGLDELIQRGDLSLVERFGENELYRFRYDRIE